jgi:hypothetical protein
MKAQDLRLFPFIAIVFFILTSCGNSDSEDSEGSVNISERTLDYTYVLTYINTGDNIYAISDGVSKSETSTTNITDGKTTQDIDESWEAPDFLAGEYDSIEIIKINDDGLTLLFKNYYNDYKLKSNWSFETSFIEGSKKDFLNGKQVKVKYLPSDLKKYEKATSKALIYILGAKGFDVEKSSIDYKSSDKTILISKDKIILEGFDKIIMNLWMNAELKEALKNK